MAGSSGRYVYFFRLSTEALKTRNRLTIMVPTGEARPLIVAEKLASRYSDNLIGLDERRRPLLVVGRDFQLWPLDLTRGQ